MGVTEQAKAVTSARRIGWLLRVNRLHGRRTRYRRLSAFVHDLSVVADRRIVVSTVSRWETGACVPPYWAVRLYERLLGLPTGSLVVTCDTVVRYFAAPSPRVPQWVRRRTPLPGQLRDLLPVLAEFASGGGHYAVLAARLVQLLPAGLRHRLPDRLWRLVSEMLQPFSTVTARRLSDEVHLDAEMADSAPDDVLPHLVHEMLYDPVFDVRLCTMFLIYATPYRRPLASALANELVRRASRGPLEQVRTVLDSLRVLGDVPERDLIERLLLAGQAPAPILDGASYALGHVGGTSSDTFWTTAITRYTDRWARLHDARTLSILDRLVYGIGITDRQPLLQAATHDPRLPATVRTAASWWADLPPYLRAGVQQHGSANR